MRPGQSTLFLRGHALPFDVVAALRLRSHQLFLRSCRAGTKFLWWRLRRIIQLGLKSATGAFIRLPLQRADGNAITFCIGRKQAKSDQRGLAPSGLPDQGGAQRAPLWIPPSFVPGQPTIISAMVLRVRWSRFGTILFLPLLFGSGTNQERPTANRLTFRGLQVSHFKFQISHSTFRLYPFRLRISFTSAGTTSNKSPTMP